MAMLAAPPNTPLLVLRCPPCSSPALGGHRSCQGRQAGCACWHMSAAIRADAMRRMREATATGSLRDSLRECLALLAQRQIRQDKITRAGLEQQGWCACGCGRPVLGSPFGRPRLYAGQGCRQRAYLARKAASMASDGSQAAAQEPFGAPSEPRMATASAYGWSPRTGWPSDEAFERYLRAG